MTVSSSRKELKYLLLVFISPKPIKIYQMNEMYIKFPNYRKKNFTETKLLENIQVIVLLLRL